MTYYVFGQDLREAGAQARINSFPQDWIMGEAELVEPVPIKLDDPEGRGDTGPKGGADNCGDIISGAQFIYSKRLCDALKEYGVELETKQARIFRPGHDEPLDDYYMIMAFYEVKLEEQSKDERLHFFELDDDISDGVAMFEVSRGISSLILIDEGLKLHLDKQNLKGVFTVPTTEFGGALAMDLTWG